MPDRLVQAIVLAEDLVAERRRMEALGFAVAEGGRHPGRGTANLIVAFGTQYLELLAVVDETDAAESPQGRPVLAALAARGPGLARWSVEAGDIGATGRRLGLTVEHRRRTRPDGVTIRWRALGVDLAWAEPWRCAFMAWDDPATHPAPTSVAHPNGATGFSRLVVGAPDHAQAEAWFGGPAPDGVVLGAGRGLSLTVPCRSGPVVL